MDRTKLTRAIAKRVLLYGGVTLLFWWAWTTFVTIPMGRGPVNLAVPREPFQQVVSAEKTYLIGLGDSVITGFGSEGKGLFPLLLGHVSDDPLQLNLKQVYPAIAYLNLANNSTTTEMHVATVRAHRKQLLALDAPALVIVSTGGIDLIHNYGSGKPQDGALYGSPLANLAHDRKLFAERLHQLMTEIKSSLPKGVEVYIQTIYDPTDGVGDIEHVSPVLRLIRPLPHWDAGLAYLHAWNAEIRALEKTFPFVHVVDVHGLFLGHGIHCRDETNPHYNAQDPGYWYYWNLEDPNVRGYDAIRRGYLTKWAEVHAR